MRLSIPSYPQPIRATATLDLTTLDPSKILTPEVEGAARPGAERYAWPLVARPKQLCPPFSKDWFIWYIEAGRGFGKTRTGAEHVRRCAESGRFPNGGICGPTISTTRNIMIEGPAGIIACCPPWNQPKYLVSKHKIVWPNGHEVEVFSAEDPDRIRGANIGYGWCDEIGTWNSAEPFDMFLLTLRIGDWPHLCVTGTPKPLPHVRALAKHPMCIMVKGSTYENRDNLSAGFFTQIVHQYEGTRLGRQEIYAEMLEDVEGALWTQGLIDHTRVTDYPPLNRIVVGVDPAASATGHTGIVVAGTARDKDGTVHAYVLGDHTISGTPLEWAREVVAAFNRHNADRVIYEKNQGGDMVLQTLRSVSRSLPTKDVWAARGKQSRAEPVSALYEQGRVHHVGMFGALESEMCTWVPNTGLPSPDRMDALVWALTSLMVGNQANIITGAAHNTRPNALSGGTGGRGLTDEPGDIVGDDESGIPGRIGGMDESGFPTRGGSGRRGKPGSMVF